MLPLDNSIRVIVIGDAPVDSEVLIVTSSISRICRPSIKDAYRDRISLTLQPVSFVIFCPVNEMDIVA
ncbi:hypothetical protein EJB05_40833, partial [Eragrostis curvula]